MYTLNETKTAILKDGKVLRLSYIVSRLNQLTEALNKMQKDMNND